MLPQKAGLSQIMYSDKPPTVLPYGPDKGKALNSQKKIDGIFLKEVEGIFAIHKCNL